MFMCVCVVLSLLEFLKVLRVVAVTEGKIS